ncbi:hypothetical protein PR001_g33891 [Phytophthora rubi]|uniref:Uncharacterized protein n=1 Tax=Phytophthora rubi TaxID=129364 RepID=A0A6A3FY29_9STRA|nr:hypothetical protein PR001_g33891 [Phytophthora rubi]
MASALAHGKISFCHNAVSLPFFCLTDNTGSGGKEGSRTDDTDAGGKVGSLTDNPGAGSKEGSKEGGRTDNTDAGGEEVLQLCV